MLKNHSKDGIDLAEIELSVPSGSSSDCSPEFIAVTLKPFEECCIWESDNILIHRQNPKLLYKIDHWTTSAITDIQLKLNFSVFAISHN
jgi:hypothetical protein